jgi:cysteine synthase B
MIHRNIIEAIGNTPMVELQRSCQNRKVRIFAKLEGHNPTGSLKDRIALQMLEAARRSGELTADKVILEPTSGNTGISLAVIGRLLGYKVKAVMPENVSFERRQLLELFGAQVVLSDGSLGSNGAIEEAQRLVTTDNFYMPYQYGNEANPLAHYLGTGSEIVRDLPETDVFVAGLGTGGTLTGVGRRLKEHNPKIKIIAAEPEQGDLVQGLRNLEEGFIPPVLDPDIMDGKILVDSVNALRGERDLALNEGIFAGISSGAVLYASLRVAERLESGTIVALLADGGWKYLSTGLWTKDEKDFGEEMASQLWA